MAARKNKRLNRSLLRASLISTVSLFLVIFGFQIYFLFYPSLSPTPENTDITGGNASVSPITLPKAKIDQTSSLTIKFDGKKTLNLTMLSQILGQTSNLDIDIYLTSDGVESLNPGVYRYSNHQLALVQPGIFNQKLFQLTKHLSLRDAGAILIMSSDEQVDNLAHFQSGQVFEKIIEQTASLDLGYNLMTISDPEELNSIFTSLDTNILYLIPIGFPSLE